MQFFAKNQMDAIRRTRYAGSWYDNNPTALSKEMDGYLGKAKTQPDSDSNERLKVTSDPITGDVLAVIVPHAGFMFSGQTAAFAYKAAKHERIKRVFVLGPSHHVGMRGAGLPQATKFATPVGDLEVDTEQVEALLTYPLFSTQSDAHAVEHSLELQMPFIKHVFGDVKIVPIIIGQLDDPSEARVIGEVLKGFVGVNDLVAVSSDFTHYGPRYQYTPFVYLEDIPGRIGKLDGEAFQHLSKVDLDGFAHFLKCTDDTICGQFPCEVLMAMLPKGVHGTLLKYATSAEIATDDTQNSVSYLAVAFSGAQWPEQPGAVRPASEVVKLSQEERQTLLRLARETMENFVRFKKVKTPEALNIQITDAMKECFGVFVTLMKKSSDPNSTEPKDLRGCIGSIYPNKPLYQGVQENAVAACSRDYRFRPVAGEELADLDVELSILTPPRRIASYNEIVVGRDGVILSKNRHQALFLPHVATEWGWDLEQMLTQLSLKAGLGPNDWHEGAKFDVFQAEKVE